MIRFDGVSAEILDLVVRHQFYGQELTNVSWLGDGLSSVTGWIQVLDFLKKEYSAMHSFIVVAVGSQHRD